MYNFYQHQNHHKLNSSNSNKLQSRSGTSSLDTHSKEFNGQQGLGQSRDFSEKLEFQSGEQQLTRLSKEIDVSLNLKVNPKKQYLKEQYYDKYKKLLFQNENKLAFQKQDNDENVCLREMYAFESLKGQLNNINENRNNKLEQRVFNRDSLSKQIQREHSKSVSGQITVNGKQSQKENKPENPQEIGKIKQSYEDARALNKGQNSQTHNNIYSAKFLAGVKDMIKKSKYVEQRDQERNSSIEVASLQNNNANFSVDENKNILNFQSQQQQQSSVDSKQIWSSYGNSKDFQEGLFSSIEDRHQMQPYYQQMMMYNQLLQSKNNTVLSSQSGDNLIQRTESCQEKPIKLIRQSIQNNKKPPVVFKKLNSMQMSKSMDRSTKTSQITSNNSTSQIEIPSQPAYKAPKKLFRIDLKKIAPKQFNNLKCLDFQKDELELSYRSIPMSDISAREAKIKAQIEVAQQKEINSPQFGQSASKFSQQSMTNNYFTSSRETNTNINQFTPTGQTNQTPAEFLPDLRTDQSQDSLILACKLRDAVSYPDDIKLPFKPILIREKQRYEQVCSAYQDGDTTPQSRKPAALKSKHSFSRKNSKVRFASNHTNERFRSLTEYSQSKPEKIAVNKILMESFLEKQKRSVQQQFQNLQENSFCSNQYISDDFYIDNSGLISLNENNNNFTPLRSFNNQYHNNN